MTYLLTCDQGERQQMLQGFDHFFAGKSQDEVANYRQNKNNLNSLLAQLNFRADSATRSDARSILKVVHADKVAQEELKKYPIGTNENKKLTGKEVSELTEEVKSNDSKFNTATLCKVAFTVLCVSTVILFAAVVFPMALAGVAFAVTAMPILSTATSAVALFFYILRSVAESKADEAFQDNFEIAHELCVLKRANPETDKEKLFALFNERVMQNSIDDDELLNSWKVQGLFTKWCKAQPTRNWQESLWLRCK